MIDEIVKAIVAIYIRVSTEEQAREGFSINAQKEKLRQYAFARGWDIYDFYIDDGISGKNLKDRPEAQRMIQDVRSKRVNNVLVYKIDRLTRSVKNLMELIELFDETNCAFNSLMESIDTSSATGRMFIKIVGIFAEFERENLAERVSFGYEQKTREGNYTNTNGVYGYDYDKDNGDIILNEDEVEIIKKIYELYLQGNSYTRIAKWLREAAIPTKRGGRWSESQVKSILSNPLYIGKIRYGLYNPKNSFTVDETRYESIMEEETFHRVQVIMQNKRKYNSRSYPSDISYFLTFLECGECGRRLSASFHADTRMKVPKTYVTYHCLNYKRDACGCKSFSGLKLEIAFQNYIEELSDIPFQEESLESEKEETPLDVKRATIEKRIAQNDIRISEIRNLFAQDKISFEEYREFSGTLSLKANQLEDELAGMIPAVEPEEIDEVAVRDIIVNLKKNWSNLTNAEKKQFLTMFVESIVVHRKDDVIIVQEISFNNGMVKVLGNH